MTTLFFVFLVLLSVIKAQDICVWFSLDEYNKNINGLYRRGTFNVDGKPFYKLDRSKNDCARDYVYIYYSIAYVRWLIGSNLGGDNLIWGQCTSTSGDPTVCSEWEIPLSVVDNTVQITDAPCPHLDCATINFQDENWPTTVGGCTSPNAYTQIGDNMYTYNGKTLWFNPLTFSWYCTDAGNANITCNPSGIYEASTGVSYSALSDGDVWQFPLGLSPGSSTWGEFTCAGTGFTTTLSPTTPNPTFNPAATPEPSLLPIASPTTSPSATPSSAPLSPVTPAPLSPAPVTVVPSSTPITPTDDNAESAGGDEEDDDMTMWIIIAVVIFVVCCCCIILIIVLYRRRKKKKQQYFGN